MESVRLVAYSIIISLDKSLNNNNHMGTIERTRDWERKTYLGILCTVFYYRMIFNMVGALELACSCMQRVTFLLNHMDITGWRVYMFTTEDSRVQCPLYTLHTHRHTRAFLGTLYHFPIHGMHSVVAIRINWIIVLCERYLSIRTGMSGRQNAVFFLNIMVIEGCTTVQVYLVK